MISPTGQGIRFDSHGLGSYGSKRGARKHAGTDYICEPGQDVISPIHGKVVREARPYADGPYSGVEICGGDCTVKLFYLSPDLSLIGKEVTKGQRIGTAQDISQKYGAEMIPHIHLEIVSINPEIFVGRL